MPTTTDCSTNYQPTPSYPIKRKSRDGVDSKRERKAAKTLAIITGGRTVYLVFLCFYKVIMFFRFRCVRAVLAAILHHGRHTAHKREPLREIPDLDLPVAGLLQLHTQPHHLHDLQSGVPARVQEDPVRQELRPPQPQLRRETVSMMAAG